MAASKLNVSELDYSQIKENLKTFLRGKSAFNDYDFEGSNLSYLIELLAYNTHYLSFYANMIANEMFLDSAIKRKSIVSRAKALGYTPRSRRSAKAIVNLTITPTGTPAFVVIPEGTKFSAAISGTRYIFTTTAAHVVQNNGGNYAVSNAELIEGHRLVHTFTVDTTKNQQFILPNANVDATTIKVRVKDDVSSTIWDIYKPAADINVATPTSEIYYVQETDEDKTEIYFGDGVLGKAVQDGNIVEVTYIVSSGDAANSANSFQLAQTVSGITNISATVVNVASGGAEKQDIESIRFLAPKMFEAQNRAVTKQDYRTLIMQDYPNIEAINVWGGEDNDPPEYGKIFIAIKPLVGTTLSQSTKNHILQNVIRPRNVISLETSLVDPDYIRIVVNSTVKYKSAMTDLSADAVKAKVIAAIKTFASTYLNDFDSYFRYSKLVKGIDACDDSVQNNLTSIKLRYELIPTLGIPTTYSIQFANALSRGDQANGVTTLTSTAFTYQGYTCYMRDLNGVIQIYRIVDGEKLVITQNAGSINYATGAVVLNKFTPTAITDGGAEIAIDVLPLNNDVQAVRNQILIIEDDQITVSLTDESTPA